MAVSDWDASYKPAATQLNNYGMGARMADRDWAELDRRAAAIRARDERIAELEGVIRSAADRLTFSNHYDSDPDFGDRHVVGAHEELCAALAGKTA